MRRLILTATLTLALALGLAASGAWSAPLFARTAAPSTNDPIVGDWNITYGAPAVVTMSISGGVYTETAKSPVRVTTSSCDLPSGTVIATFSSAGGNSYSGKHGLWSTTNCSFAYWTSLKLTLSSDGRTLTSVLGNGETPTFTKILTPPPAKCVVPNVVGMRLSTAVSRIAKAHCRPGRVIRQVSTRARKDYVLAQNPKPGKRLKNGAKVTLTVGKGPTKR